MAASNDCGGLNCDSDGSAAAVDAGVSGGFDEGGEGSPEEQQIISCYDQLMQLEADRVRVETLAEHLWRRGTSGGRQLWAETVAYHYQLEEEQEAELASQLELQQEDQ